MKKKNPTVEDLLRTNNIFEIKVALKCVRSLVFSKYKNKFLVKDKQYYAKVCASLCDLINDIDYYIREL